MKRLILSVLLVLLAVLPGLVQGSVLQLGLPRADSMVSATTVGSSPRLEVWNPDLRSSNITSTTMFPQGSLFSVRVNVTNAGPISGFDVTLNYNVTMGPNILQAVRTGSEMSGGLFDPSSPPSGCSVFVVKQEVDAPAGEIRFAAVFLGGCSTTGTGMLFSMQFQVTGTGTSFIDVVQTQPSGLTATEIVSAGPNFHKIEFSPFNARFQNAPGIAPVARFTYDPLFPVKGDNISFAGGQSFDPDNPGGVNNGISKYLWIFGGIAQWGGPDASHIFVFQFSAPVAGNFTVTLVVWDSDNNLANRVNIIVDVSQGVQEAASSNWSGYAVYGPPGSVNDVRGSWKVQAVVGACGATTQYSSFWVGIDGFNSQTVEQTGTVSACVAGTPTYYAWYEFYPKSAMVIHSMTVQPGDTMYGEVSVSTRGQFNLTLADLTSKRSFTKLGNVRGAQLSSAEWIAEAPSSSTGILPLANFGTVYFGQDATGVSGTCEASVNGVSGPIGSFRSHAVQIIMLSKDLTLKAGTSPLSPDSSSFFVQWFFSGP